MRHTRSQVGQNRAHKKLSKPSLTRDQNGAISIRHRVSAVTGMYKGRQVIDVNKKLIKKAKKNQPTSSEKPSAEKK
ncbi:MAG TPA: 50S ribosomal protein L32 [Candidatus Paceibacterota bacterium]|nr:50S ribosomal protein L32 [Candidatus Paceibacterota bacterium]